MAANQMQLEDWLDDLCVRFIINLPQEDLSSVARICFQVEEAQWFYEDFIRPLDPTLPSMSLRIFCLRIFQHCPLLASFSADHHTKAFEEFLQYKTRVPVRGAIMLNHAMDSVVLVKGWKKGASWSFPRGKINKDEDDLDCAVREVYEETGLDLRAAGLVPTEKKPKYIEINMREQQLRLYVFRDVPMDTDFQPRTRKEISKIQWYKLSDLPAFRKKGDKGTQNRNDAGVGGGGSKFYMVAPFLVPLKKWIVSQKKVDDKRAVSSDMPSDNADQVPTRGDATWAPESVHLHVPAMGDANGARQPHVQDYQILQAPPRQDKGSALLSILQAGGKREENHMPQTPLDLTMANPPQPRNPHHHSNQQPVRPDTFADAPPAFQLAPYPATHSSMLPPTHAASLRSASENVATMSQQFRSSGEALLPFHGASHGVLSAQQARLVQSQRGHGPQVFQGQNEDREQAQTQAMRGPKPVQLNGHSMSLLNVLKRDTTLGPPTQDTNSGQNQWPSPGYGAPNLSPYADEAVPRGLPGMLDNTVRHASLPQASLNMVGSSSNTDNHRSALLGMFKKDEPDGVRREAPPGSQGGTLPAATGGNGARMEAMQAPDVGGRLPETRTFSVNHLSMRSQLAQHGAPDGRAWENTVPLRQALGQTSPQPTRILQRGQTFGVGQPFGPTPSRDREAQAGSDQHGSPQAAWAGEPGGRTGGSEEQKKRLLSLFSQQQSGSIGKMDGASRPRVSTAPGGGLGSFGAASSPSSRRGTGTPMSPAEQSFFLEYLQTVTNNASR